MTPFFDHYCRGYPPMTPFLIIIIWSSHMWLCIPFSIIIVGGTPPMTPFLIIIIWSSHMWLYIPFSIIIVGVPPYDPLFDHYHMEQSHVTIYTTSIQIQVPTTIVICDFIHLFLIIIICYTHYYGHLWFSISMSIYL